MATLPALLTEGATAKATPESVSLIVPGRASVELSIRSAGILRDALDAAIRAKLLPTPAFRWFEPSGDFKSSAALLCEDPRYLARYNEGYVPPGFDGIQNARTRLAAVILQQRTDGQAVPLGTYQCFVAPHFTPMGSTFRDFEEAQNAVCSAVKGMLGIP